MVFAYRYMAMEITTVYLTSKQHEYLRTKKRDTGTGMGYLIRQALDKYMEENPL